MTSLEMTHGASVNNGSRHVGWRSPLARLRRAVARHREYLRTFGELSALTDRELADLGLSRLSIRDIAWESVYGR
jgi:uncharacterized protein YjiS (DUF1127 family)